MKLFQTFVLAVFTLSVTLFSDAVLAAEITLHSKGDYRYVSIEGKIARGDFKKIESLFRENNGSISSVCLYSPGGDFDEAMKIGRLLRTLEISSQVPMLENGLPYCSDYFFAGPKDPKNCTCASSCFFIHIGAVHRGGTFLAVHRPYYVKGLFGTLSQSEAKDKYDSLLARAKDYMGEMGVPKRIQEDILATPSDKYFMISEKDVKTHFWDAIPHRYEWFKNKCSELTPQEKKRFDDYNSRIIKAARNKTDWGFSQQEMQDFDLLKKKDEMESDCIIEAMQKSRIDAYQKYFKTSKDAIFSKKASFWPTATNYLGKNINNTVTVNGFGESIVGDGFFEKMGTGSEPTVVISNIGSDDSSTISWVNYVSTENVGRDFFDLVVTTLTKEWGVQAVQKDENKYEWINDKFSAEATFEYPKTRKSCVILVVKSR